jgi:hypothetical protein
MSIIIKTGGPGGYTANVDPSGNLAVSTNSQIISTLNSSTLPLGSNAVFTGLADSCLNYDVLNVTVATDVNGSFVVQQGTDGVHWDITSSPYSVTGGVPFLTNVPVSFSQFRVVYTNGAGAQTIFRLQVVRKPSTQIASVTSLPSLPPGSNAIGEVSIAPGSQSLNIAAGVVGATVTAIKASPGQLFGWYFYNDNAVKTYVQFFNKVVGSVTLGVTAPDFVFVIPPSSGANALNDIGIGFDTALSFAMTTTRTGAASPPNDCDYNFFYL